MEYRFNEAFRLFEEIEREFPVSSNLNEAQTRFNILDKIIKQSLNWEDHSINVEVRNDQGFSDYCLGAPARCVIEAKREGIHFEIPITDTNPAQAIEIKAIIKGNSALESALEQVKSYCNAHGVPIGVVSNGHQFVAFLATRLDGVAPLAGQCIAFRSLSKIKENFTLFWNCLSYDGVLSNNLSAKLLSIEAPPPSKLASGIVGYPKFRDSDDLQATLRQLSELVLQDIVESSDLEKEFFKECYCVSGPLTQFSLLSKNILQARYDSMFSDEGGRPVVVPVNKRKSRDGNFGQEVVAEATAKRPIVLIGDVGVGKTSFIKNLIYNDAAEQFKNAIYIYIDLGSKATLTKDFRRFVLKEINDNLNSILEGGVSSILFLTELYKPEIKEFEGGPNGLLKDLDPAEYQRRYADFLIDKLKDTGAHLRESIAHINKKYRRDVIVFIDNADQRDFDTQQNAFLVAQEISNQWRAISFVAVRPSTFFRSKMSGALSAYPHKVFTISPPKLEEALVKRLSFALGIVSGKRTVQAIQNISIRISSLAVIIGVIIKSINTNPDLLELITNISSGNVRESINLIVKYIGSPNVDAYNILKQLEDGNDYIIPVHEMSRAVILGDFENYNPESSIALNVFDTDFADPKGHFLILSALSILQRIDSAKDVNGYLRTDNLINQLQKDAGFTEEQIKTALIKCINKKLVEGGRRLTVDEAAAINKRKDLPATIRITSSGAYHFVKWMGSFSYLEAVSIDTPIFDKAAREKIGGALGYRLRDRYDRASHFRDYLISQWGNFPQLSAIVDFAELIENNSFTFKGVENALLRSGKLG